LAIKNEIIEEKNKDMLDSIRYASAIQQAVITSEEYIRGALSSSEETLEGDNFFILYLPKDIVAGDFYWAFKRDDDFFIATGDCTGHGVPGAFMSLMGINFLNEIVVEQQISSPGETLNRLRQHIISAFASGKTERKDGMDISFYMLNKKKGMLTYAAANNPLWLCRSNKITEYKSDKMPVGIHYGATTPFQEQTFELQKGDIVYSFTDGYADQFGGPKGKKFKYKQLEELLLSIQHLPMKEQHNTLEKTINSWRGALEQVDDILVIGVKI
jgi:serine phosphatase RsbU (regulator of sigma subunit)